MTETVLTDLNEEAPLGTAESLVLGEKVFKENPLERRDTGHNTQEHVGGLLDT